MPDFGEAFDRREAMLLTMPTTAMCPEASQVRSVPSGRHQSQQATGGCHADLDGHVLQPTDVLFVC